MILTEHDLLVLAVLAGELLGNDPGLDHLGVLFEGALEGCLPEGLVLLLLGWVPCQCQLRLDALANLACLPPVIEALVGVYSFHGGAILEEVHAHELAEGAERLVDAHGLNSVRLDDTADIRVGERGTGEEPSNLDLGGLVTSSEDGVELLESTLGPDDEATKVASRCKLKEIQTQHVDGGDTKQVSEGGVCPALATSDDQRSNLDSLGPVPQAGLTGVLPDLLAPVHIIASTKDIQESAGALGLGELLNGISVNNQGDLRDLPDLVTTSQHKGSDAGRSDGRGKGVPLLVDVDLAVPLPPGASGGEHSSTAAHVTEGSLASTVCATTRHPRNTSYSPTSTP